MIHDTARTAPKVPEVADWLASQQQSDGGWDSPDALGLRLVSTASALIALKSYPEFASQVEAGLTFLEENCGYLVDLPLDSLPQGVSLVLPKLLHEMSRLGWSLDLRPFAALFTFGDKRRNQLNQVQVVAPSPLLHVFEGWGQVPDPHFLDDVGSVGHSPAATIRWIELAQERECSVRGIAQAKDYLISASEPLGGWGLQTCNWPIPRFEQSFGLWILLISGLLTAPDFHESVRTQLTDLRGAIRDDGIGMSDAFPSDGDDTAALAAVLAYLGDHSLIPVLLQKSQDGHFLTFPVENHPSLTTTARCCHALQTAGLEPPRAALTYLLEKQSHCGRWLEDKWHASWLYSTLHGVLAVGADHPEAAFRAAQALITHQHRDGGWGMGDSTASETAYAIHTLMQVQEWGLMDVRGPLRMAYLWLASQPIEQVESTRLWIGKGGYCPVRVDQMFVLTALARCERVLEVQSRDLSLASS